MQREIINLFDGRKREDKLKEENGQDPEAKDVIRIWNHASQDTDGFCPDVNKAWDCVSSKIRQKSDSGPVRLFYWVAASIGILLGAYFAYNTYILPGTSPVTEIAARDGEVKEVVLPDGSAVWINAGGSIAYNKQLPRSISLNGEAFFKVAHDPAHPFVVTSSGVQTTVLGTEFNVNDRADAVTIDVLSGKVEINALNRTVQATPHTRVMISKEENKITKTASVGSNFLFWKTGLLEFHDAPLHDILEQINYHYKSEVSTTSQLRQCRLTLSLNKMTLDESLEVIATLVGGVAEKDGSAVTITGGSCEQVN